MHCHALWKDLWDLHQERTAKPCGGIMAAKLYPKSRKRNNRPQHPAEKLRRAAFQ